MLQPNETPRRTAIFERYTEAAKTAIVSSKIKASHLGNREIDTEHVLLGLLSTDKGLAVRFLGSPWAADAVWRKIEHSKRVGLPIEGPCDLPLSKASKRALSYAAEEADQLMNRNISTEHLLLGLLREEKCFAAEFLHEHGVQLASVREELMRLPHKFNSSEQFVRKNENPLPREVVDLQNQINSIFRDRREAFAQRDFAKARKYLEEEATLRRKWRSLCQQYELSDWLYE